MCGYISHCTVLKALGFWSKYCSLYLNEMISLLSGAVLPPVLRPRQCVRDSPFNILPSIEFAFWKFVFHGEEHHQSNSKITPNYLHCRIFGHVLEPSCWPMKVTREKLSSCDTYSLAFTSYAPVTGKSMSWLFILRLKEIQDVALKVDLMLYWCVLFFPFWS